MSKNMREKQSEIDVLKDMIVSTKSEIRTKDITITKLKKWVDTLEKINGIRGQRLNSDVNSMNSFEKESWIPPKHSKRGYDDDAHDVSIGGPEMVEIEEAEEGLEATGALRQDSRGNWVLPSKTPNMNLIK